MNNVATPSGCKQVTVRLEADNAGDVIDWTNVILRKNFGFIDNTPVQFDIGKFKFDPQKKCDKNEIRILVKGFYRWIGNNYPELIPVFDETLDNVCAKEDILKEKKSTFS